METQCNHKVLVRRKQHSQERKEAVEMEEGATSQGMQAVGKGKETDSPLRAFSRNSVLATT